MAVLYRCSPVRFATGLEIHRHLCLGPTIDRVRSAAARSGFTIITSAGTNIPDRASGATWAACQEGTDCGPKTQTGPARP